MIYIHYICVCMCVHVYYVHVYIMYMYIYLNTFLVSWQNPCFTIRQRNKVGWEKALFEGNRFNCTFS